MTETVLVLSGGDSPEREVSIRSGRAVSQALRTAGFRVTEYDPVNGLDTLLDLARDADVVFPILHGIHGEDGTIQSLLEQHTIRYLGSSSSVSKVCFDKIATHKRAQAASITMPNYQKVSLEDIHAPIFQKPYVLKPITGGSSIDTHIVRVVDKASIEQTKYLLEKYTWMLTEELINGIEVTVGILDSMALPPIYIKPPHGAEFDYDNKYNGKTQEICPIPEELVSRDLQQRVQSLALAVHQLFGCRHLSRVDVIIGNNDELYVLEINTMPGMTDKSLYPLSAAAHGLMMPELVKLFVEHSIKE